MAGATALDVYKNAAELTQHDFAMIAVGFIVAFLSALFVVRTFVAFIGRHGFAPFALYRIALGAAALVGLIAGLLGMGGGQIMVPLFMAVIGLEPRKAIGTSSFVIMVSAVFGAGTYSLKGMVDFPAAGFLSGGSILGVLIGTALLSRAPGGKLKSMYLILAIIMLLCLILKQFVGQAIPLTLLIGSCLLLIVYAAYKVLAPRQSGS